MDTPGGFALRVPESWFEFDVWRATRTGDLARLVDARIRREPGLARLRGALLRLLRESASEAERQGALFCAAMADFVGDEGMLAASVMVFQRDASDPVEMSVDAIAGQITAMVPADGSASWRRVEIVELAAGRAVRVRGLESAELADRGAADCVVMQTLVPIPDGGGVLNVVFTSPQVQLAEPMLELFEAISSTLSWVPAGGDPPVRQSRHHASR